MAGWIYIATNKHMPGLIKIGMSSKQPSKYRMHELSTATSIPSKFRAEYEAIVEDEVHLERMTHRAFAHNRVSHNREFFDARVADVVTFIRNNTEVIKVYQSHVLEEEMQRREAGESRPKQNESRRRNVEEELKREQAMRSTLKELICGAEHGDIWAQYSLAVRYHHGWSVARNHTTAVTWYRQAAKQGHAEAQFNLANMYRNGLGVPQDDAEAVTWFCRAAKQGLADAQHNLGLMYQHGRGAMRNYVLAHMWFNLAASQGEKMSLGSPGGELGNRDMVARRMTPAQIARAQALAAQCLASDYQDCGE